jgi:hypothetical protein
MAACGRPWCCSLDHSSVRGTSTLGLVLLSVLANIVRKKLKYQIKRGSAFHLELCLESEVSVGEKDGIDSPTL